MKDEILVELESIKSSLKYPIYQLKYRLNYLDSFNYYWQVLEFINWVKNNHPQEYEYYELESYYHHIINFGYFYIKVFNPQPTPIVYDDGILGIGIPIEEMITQLYEFVINLNDSEATDLKTVLDSINLLKETLLQKPASQGVEGKIDKLLQTVNPTTEYKTKQEEREAIAKAEIAKMLLKK